MTVAAEMTTQEVADFLGVSEARVRQFRLAGRLPAARRVGQVFVFDRDAVKRFKRRPRPAGGDRRSKAATAAK